MKSRNHFPNFPLKLTTFLALSVHLVVIQAVAHEFWLAPSTHTPQEGEQVEVYAMIGHGAESQAFARDPDHIQYFRILDDQGQRSADGINHQLPTARLHIRNTGSHIVAYQSHPQKSVLPAKKFNRYLKEEGMHHILAWMDDEQDPDALVLEQYTRCAKSLLWQRGGDGTFKDRWVGMPLEIKTLNNPFQLGASQKLVVQIQFEGEPLPGILIKAIRPGSNKVSQKVRTDSQGMASFQCGEGGRWLLNAIHMIPGQKSESYSWKSYWASLTVDTGNLNQESNDLAQWRTMP